MVSEGLTNPRQLINIITSCWQRMEMTVILSNIMENLRKFSIFNGGHEGHDNLEATWLANTRHYG